ncbi:ABC transporter substrate-binding protein [Aquitalea sp. LB_tupeE]|uniref:substrate-binding periplasmic protein n=1 Tax=Aquitalea sp. LB_tupeE TaxID=2748078 RepID=UPI0015BE190F|nr:transporter substrate-binding domain-containing protein [Aquitalea sp. LB_tupeE]NWK79698.1 transporter substrate-binding domain-containing protein [Aquitalea sp. LB_tupeE]
MQCISRVWPCLMFVLPAYGAVVACGGDNQWPPSSYQLASTAEVQGFSPDVLRAILGPEGGLQVRLMPFARCLALAEQGSQVQIVMAASRTPNRERQFLFSKPYLQLHPVSVTMQPMLAGSDRLPWCGLNGFNYQAFGLRAEEVDRGSANYPDLLRKLRAGHCRGFVEYREVWQGLLRLGVLSAAQLPPLVLSPLAGRPAVDASFMISRRMPGAELLRQQLDKGLQAMAARGELAALLKRQLP